MFLDLLVRCAKIIFVTEYPFKNIDEFEPEMLFRLLEHMEISHGFIDFK